MFQPKFVEYSIELPQNERRLRAHLVDIIGTCVRELKQSTHGTDVRTLSLSLSSTRFTSPLDGGRGDGCLRVHFGGRPEPVGTRAPAAQEDADALGATGAPPQRLATAQRSPAEGRGPRPGDGVPVRGEDPQRQGCKWCTKEENFALFHLVFSEQAHIRDVPILCSSHNGGRKPCSVPFAVLSERSPQAVLNSVPAI